MNHYFSPGDGSWKPRTIEVELAGVSRQIETGPGIFSPEHIDSGTRLLLETVPNPVSPLLDIGCGWGPIALSAALIDRDVEVWAVDVNERALELTERNRVNLGLENITVADPDTVPADLRFGAIWSNPPIRVGKAELHAILEKWLPRLLPGSSAWLVVAKNLGAESLMKWLSESWPTASVSKAETSGGFWVIEFRLD